MEDEVFEKIYETIKKYFGTYALYDGGYGAKIRHEFPEDERKQKLKQILEEIYNKGYEDGEPAKWTIHYPKNVKRG